MSYNRIDLDHHHHHHHRYDWGHPIPSTPQPAKPAKPFNYMKWVLALLTIIVVFAALGVIGNVMKKPVVVQIETVKTDTIKAETPSSNAKGVINGKDNNVNVGDNNKNVHVGDNKFSHITINQTQNVTIINRTVVQPVKVIRVPMNQGVDNKGDCDDLKLQHEVRLKQWQKVMKN